MTIEITTDIELCNQPLEDLGAKLQTISEALPIEPSKAKGFNNSSDVELQFFDYKGNLLASVSGSYRESDDKMPAVLTIFGNGKQRQGSTFNFNWHPFSSLGGFDKKEFEAQFVKSTKPQTETH